MKTHRKLGRNKAWAGPFFVLAFLLFGAGTNNAVAAPLSDNTISQKVEQRFLFDRSNILSDIHAVTLNGVVTLTGKAQTLLEKERAADIARIIRGVKSVINAVAIEPQPGRTDDQIREDAEDALLYDYATNSWQIDVAVVDHVATLKGTVDSRSEKELAEKLVKGVKGIQRVRNDLTVESKMKDRDDHQIQAEIMETLQWDVLVNDESIGVQVEGGQVTLKGTVGSAAEEKQAYSDAWVRGVVSVDDSGLRVDPREADADIRRKANSMVSDKDIRATIGDAINYDPRVDASSITADVRDGAVTLNGVVDNRNAKRAADQDARNTIGVRSVDNRISIQIATPTDAEIARRIKRILSGDPYIGGNNIGVRVEDGSAFLSGTVDGYFEKVRADDLAAGTYGISKVENGIDVKEQIYQPVVDPYFHQVTPKSKGRREKSDRATM